MSLESDGAGLLARILDNPEDDAPRLIYSDWMEENGQEEQAEYIRYSISSAKGIDLPPKTSRLTRK